MLTATCSNAHGLLAIRFFLGATEAAIGPGLTVIVAMWYKRSEQPLRHGAWFMGNVIAGIVGGILAYAVGHVQSIAPWKVKPSAPLKTYILLTIATGRLLGIRSLDCRLVRIHLHLPARYPCKCEVPSEG